MVKAQVTLLMSDGFTMFNSTCDEFMMNCVIRNSEE